ncbi:MAG: hypothetical protein JWN32_2877, partial [Solirubrobacterales bacterium]|nr:hypothetical protein [Solirubrobacterales bacterium]
MRSRLKHRRVVGLAVAASALAVAAPVAVAQPSDIGASNLAAPTSAQPATARVDPRSPDARDAALAAQTSVQPA